MNDDYLYIFNIKNQISNMFINRFNKKNFVNIILFLDFFVKRNFN